VVSDNHPKRAFSGAAGMPGMLTHAGLLAVLSRPQRITVDMGFELAIAAKHDPIEGREPVFERGRSPVKTLTFHASGAFSHENGAVLAEAIDDAIAPEFCAYIVCLEAVDNVEESALLTFAQWIRSVGMKASTYGFAP